MITFSAFIGGIFATKITVTFFQPNDAIISNFDNNEMNDAVDTNYSRREINQLECCGHSDVTPPEIELNSPANNSHILGGATINLLINDDNFMFKMGNIFYNWGVNDHYNKSPIILEPEVIGDYDFVLPTDYKDYVVASLGEPCIIMNVYARDFSGHWASAKFRFTVPPPPPFITLNFPTNNSVMLGNITIDVNITDKFSDITQVLYRWDIDQSNTTFDPPYDVLLPEVVGAYFLYVYAENDVGEWASALFKLSVTDDPSAVTMPPLPTTTIPTTTTTSTTTTPVTSGFEWAVILLGFSILSIVIVLFRKKKRKA